MEENIHPELTERQFYPDCECDHCFVQFDTWKERITNKYLVIKKYIKRTFIYLRPFSFKTHKIGACGSCSCAIIHDDFAWTCAHYSKKQQTLCHELMSNWTEVNMLFPKVFPLVFNDPYFVKMAKKDILASMALVSAQDTIFKPLENKKKESEKAELFYYFYQWEKMSKMNILAQGNPFIRKK